MKLYLSTSPEAGLDNISYMESMFSRKWRKQLGFVLLQFLTLQPPIKVAIGFGAVHTKAKLRPHCRSRLSIRRASSTEDTDNHEEIIETPTLDAIELFPDADLQEFSMLPHRPMGLTVEESLADSNYVLVTGTVEGGYADKAGIKVGDVLVAITGLFGDLVPVLGLGVEKVKGMVASRPEKEALEVQVARGTNVLNEHEKAVIELCSIEGDEAQIDQCIAEYVSSDFGEGIQENDELCDPEDDGECLVNNLFDMWAEDMPTPLQPPTSDDQAAPSEKPSVKPWSSRSSPSGTYVRDPVTGEMKNIG